MNATNRQCIGERSVAPITTVPENARLTADGFVTGRPKSGNDALQLAGLAP
jgi:hypothetical protein